MKFGKALLTLTKFIPFDLCSYSDMPRAQADCFGRDHRMAEPARILHSSSIAVAIKLGTSPGLTICHNKEFNTHFVEK